MDNENNRNPGQVDPLARILNRAAGQVLHDRSSDEIKDSIFFVGNWHDSIPRAIWTDPLLDGTDVRIWGFLRSLVQPWRPRCRIGQYATAGGFGLFEADDHPLSIGPANDSMALALLKDTR
jgi:hypothetical protein